MFTDRGTFQYLENAEPGAEPADRHSRQRVGPREAADTELINSFHAYAINPAPFAGDPERPHQHDGCDGVPELDHVTGSAQTEVGNFLSDQPDGAPFIPDASPQIAVSSPPLSVDAATTSRSPVRSATSFRAHRTSDGETVSLVSAPTIDPNSTSVVAQTTTGAGGDFTFSYTPSSRACPGLGHDAPDQKIENSDLQPHFGDLLSPASTPQL